MKSVYPELNFPTFQHKLKEEKNQTKIWDPIRKSWIILTSEEWVRQNVIQYFIEVLHYPLGLMQSEAKVKIGKLNQRFDLVVNDRNLQPWLICECKATGISVDQSVVTQAARYNSQLKCPYLTVTNGLEHYCFQIDFNAGTFKPLHDFPTFPIP